jgi:hypothetical protein
VPERTARISDTWAMSSFLSLVRSAGIAILILMAVLVAITAIIGIVVSFSPTLIPGFLQS